MVFPENSQAWKNWIRDRSCGMTERELCERVGSFRHMCGGAARHWIDGRSIPRGEVLDRLIQVLAYDYDDRTEAYQILGILPPELTVDDSVESLDAYEISRMQPDLHRALCGLAGLSPAEQIQVAYALPHLVRVAVA